MLNVLQSPLGGGSLSFGLSRQNFSHHFCEHSDSQSLHISVHQRGWTGLFYRNLFLYDLRPRQNPTFRAKLYWYFAPQFSRLWHDVISKTVSVSRQLEVIDSFCVILLAPKQFLNWWLSGDSTRGAILTSELSSAWNRVGLADFFKSLNHDYRWLDNFLYFSLFLSFCSQKELCGRSPLWAFCRAQWIASLRWGRRYQIF